jgi:ribosomal protein L7/L12
MSKLNTKVIRQLLDVVDAEPKFEQSVINMITEILRPVHELSVEEIDAGIRLGKLRAVKMHKERTKCSLMDSKHIVEQYFKDHGLQFPPLSC